MAGLRGEERGAGEQRWQLMAGGAGAGAMQIKRNQLKITKIHIKTVNQYLNLGPLRCRGGTNVRIERREGAALMAGAAVRWRGGLDCGSVSGEGAESAGVSHDMFVPPRCGGGNKRAD
jgi:hypothetical protein